MVNPLNPGDVFAGAAGGLLFSVLYDGLKELTIKYLMFKPLVESIEFTLKSLQKASEEIEQLNHDLRRPKEEIAGLEALLEEGKKLIDKCLKVRAWRPDKQYKYSNKLIEWNDSLTEKLKILIVIAIRDVKEILKTAKRTENTLNQIESSIFTIKEGVEEILTNTADIKIAVKGTENTLNQIRNGARISK